MQKQRTLVENEQLRMELEATHRRNTEHESMQTNFVETESEFVHACPRRLLMNQKCAI